MLCIRDEPLIIGRGRVCKPAILNDRSQKLNLQNSKTFSSFSFLPPVCTPQTIDGKKHELEVPEWKSVLEAFLDEGIELPHDCKLGTCLVGLGTPCT